LFLLIGLSNNYCFGQKLQQDSYESLKEKYDGFDKNDAKALPFVNRFILKAKKRAIIQNWFKGIKMLFILSQINCSN
jgi:hypothetical protein